MVAVRNVIFDLGGVLLEWAPGRILENFYADTDSRVLMQTALFKHPDWRAFNRGGITEQQLLDGLAARSGRPPAELAGLLDAIRHSLVVKQETVVVLRKLHARGIPLYCLSDMPAPMFAFVRSRYDFFETFRGIVVSGHVRLMKPEREVFEHLLGHFRLVAAETLFIDDHWPNIEGARNVGLHAVQFVDAIHCEQDLMQYLEAGRASAG
jgi:putative hydrolase of the HAD superfamily